MANINYTKPEKLEDFSVWCSKKYPLWCKSNFPFIEDTFEALDTYGLICKIVQYLNETKQNLNTTENNVQNIYDFVTNYFDNLDVQNEINNKLDSMVSSGELQTLLTEQYNSLRNEINNEINFQNLKLNSIDNKVNNAVSGSPAGVYDTLEELMTENPSHERIYVVKEDGNWYYWDSSISQWNNGGIYQAVQISESDNAIVNINQRLNGFNNFINYIGSESITTDFQLEIGEKIIIESLNENSSLTVFTVGYPNDKINVIGKGLFEFTPQNKGYIRIYNTNQNIYNLKLYINNILREEMLKNKLFNYNYISNQPAIESIQLKNKIVHNNFISNSNSYNFSSRATIENINDYILTSSVAKSSPVLRLKDNLGNQIYKLRLSKTISDIYDANAIFAFDNSGKYLTNYKYKDLTDEILDSIYYAILIEYPTVNNYTDLYFIVENVYIEWLNNKKIYTVGQGKDFNTFTEMLTALENDISEKTVYVEPGIYNIFEEVGGAEYMQTLIDTASSLNWRDVNKVVPPNTTIIGKGNVTLTWLATPEEMQNNSDIAFLFSPLNVSGECIIKNINVIAKNCRYTIHDETSGRAEFKGVNHIFENCNFKYLQSQLGVKMCYGAGHSPLMNIIFNNCEFYNYHSIIWSSHDWFTNNINENSNILFNHCIFNSENEGKIRFSSSDTIGRKDEVKFDSCFINGNILITTEGATNIKQGYEITLLNSTKTNIEYSDNITDRYGMIELNSINN